jgi:tetratricopeptide (TPR) repeat protein
LKKILSFKSAPVRALLSALFFLFVISAVPVGGMAEDVAQIHFFHALKAKEEGDYLEAERLFRRAVNLEPQNPDYHFELGNLYIERKYLELARREFEQAVMIAPHHLAAHFNLGLVYRDRGLMSEARDEFRKVLELDPANTKAQLQIGYTYQEQGFTEDARQEFELAREMDVTDPEPDRALGDLKNFEIELEHKRRMEAAQSFQRNQSLFNQTRSFNSYSNPAAESETVGKGALLQAGIAVLQQMMAQRAQAKADNSTGS